MPQVLLAYDLVRAAGLAYVIAPDDVEQLARAAAVGRALAIEQTELRSLEQVNDLVDAVHDLLDAER